MTRVYFAAHLQRHVPTPEIDVEAGDLREALAKACVDRPLLRGYILDDQGRLRRHVAVYINGQPAKDRITLSDRIAPGDEIAIFQALSGG
jgi:molybdopterin converting factor small subunit